jgi:MYXO-CTERM domain-containing protein
MMRRRLSHEAGSYRRVGRPRWLLPGATALLCALGGIGSAFADIPDPPRPDDDDDDESGVCLPNKSVGDDCDLPDGSDGVCVDETQPCGFDGGETIYCHVCEEDGCSIAAAGGRSTSGTGWVALGALAAFGLLSRRRRR